MQNSQKKIVRKDTRTKWHNIFTCAISNMPLSQAQFFPYVIKAQSPRCLPRDLKACIPILYYEQNFTIKEICGLLGIKTLSYSSTYGVPYNPHARTGGCHQILNREDIKFILALIECQHCIYLDEIQEELYQHCDCRPSIPTLVCTLQRLDHSWKCVSIHALERNDILHAAFMNTVAEKVPWPDMLMFLDEAARNWKTSGRTRGWALVGRRCVQRRFFVQGKQYSILLVLTMDGIITYDVIPGSVTSACFVKFLWELVILLTNPYPGPWSILILDNCSIHHSEEVRALVEDEAQCKLIF